MGHGVWRRSGDLCSSTGGGCGGGGGGGSHGGCRLLGGLGKKLICQRHLCQFSYNGSAPYCIFCNPVELDTCNKRFNDCYQLCKR